MSSRLTVVVITRNRALSLRRAVGKLCSLPDEVPVIVIDNASDTPASAVLAPHPRLTVVRLARNLGAAGRNVGAELATSPYIAFSDDDSWWAPGALSLMTRAFETCGSLGLAVGTVLLEPGGRRDPVSEKMAGLPRRAGLPGPDIVGFPACAAAVRREPFLRAGGFSPLLFFGGEETMLGLDLISAGWDACYLPGAVAHHAPSPRREPGPVRWRQHARNDVMVAWLRRPVPVALAASARLAGRALGNREAARAALAVVRLAPALATGRRPCTATAEQRLKAASRAGAGDRSAPP
jgi:GT2 family glycosyltransferase